MVGNGWRYEVVASFWTKTCPTELRYGWPRWYHLWRVAPCLIPRVVRWANFYFQAGIAREGLEGLFSIFGERAGEARMLNVPDSDSEGVRWRKNKKSTFPDFVFCFSNRLPSLRILSSRYQLNFSLFFSSQISSLICERSLLFIKTILFFRRWILYSDKLSKWEKFLLFATHLIISRLLKTLLVEYFLVLKKNSF